MCERRSWRAGAACLVATFAAQTALAQSTVEYAKRVDSLTAVWRVAVAAQVRADSERVRRLPLDTIREGNLIVLSDSAYATLAKATAAIVSSELERSYGSWAARMRTHILVVRRPARRWVVDDSSTVESGVASADGRVLMPSSTFASTEALSAAWRRQAEVALSSDLTPALREWLGVATRSDPVTARTLAAGRVDLVLSRSRAAHDCALGTIASCSRALDLVAVNEPAFTLFDERERRDLIQWYSFVLRLREPSKYARCTAGQQAACDSLIRSMPADVIPRPVSPAVRLNFVRYALLIGGEGAFDRLANTEGTVADRVAAAARMPIDSAVTRWQANLMSSASSSTTMDAATAVSSLFWACLCGALALRSSRWR
jgi:hypothetical protein